jgi:lysophospholipase L1-like esterase
VPRSLALLAVVALTAACGVGDGASGVDATGSEAFAAPDEAMPRVLDIAPSGGAAEPAVDEGAAERVPAVAVDELVSPRSGVEMPETVAVVGDSLTLSASDEIASALQAVGLEVVAVDGKENRRMAQGSRGLTSGTEAIETILDADPPEIWVVALGTNDVGAQVTPETFADDLGAVLELVPADAPLVWVDVWIRDRAEEVVRANRAIRSALRRRTAPTAVVDWFSYGEQPGVITGDGIHLTDEGQLRFAAAIAAAVAELFGG